MSHETAGSGQPKTLPVRIDDELHQLVKEAAEVSGCRSVSDWVRTALEAGAVRELAERDRREEAERIAALTPQPNPGRLGARPGEFVGGCLHPRHLRRRRGTQVFCAGCEVEIRR